MSTLLLNSYSPASPFQNILCFPFYVNFKTVAKIIFFIQPTLRCIGGLLLKSRCKGAKLFLGAQYSFHRILTLQPRPQPWRSGHWRLSFLQRRYFILYAHILFRALILKLIFFTVSTNIFQPPNYFCFCV